MGEAPPLHFLSQAYRNPLQHIMQNSAKLKMPSFCSKLPKVLDSADFKPGMTDKPGTHSAFFTVWAAGTTATALRSAREATLPKQQTQGGDWGT